MRALLPQAASDIDPVAAYAPPDDVPADRPFVRCNMISSLDGAIVVDGRSGALGGPADRRVFTVLRAWADVVIVGAGTARTEGYGPARLDDGFRRQRAERGQSAVPAIAVVTRSCKLDWTSPLFTEADTRSIVVTVHGADPANRRQAEAVADVIIVGEDTVDFAAAMRALRERGHRSVLVEGGPAINREIVAAGLLDELCLTLAPKLVAGDGPRVLAGADLPHPLELETVHLLEAEGCFFHRLRVTTV